MYFSWSQLTEDSATSAAGSVMGSLHVFGMWEETRYDSHTEQRPLQTVLVLEVCAKYVQLRVASEPRVTAADDKDVSF